MMHRRNLHPAIHRPFPATGYWLPATARGGFTLIELMIVIGIIVVLVAILIPVVSSVRESAKAASTQALISQLQGAIERYHQDFRSYPGPLSDFQIRRNAGVGVISGLSAPWDTNLNHARFTMAENLVLGLLGGLTNVTAGTPNPPDIRYDPALVGKGPRSLAAVRTKTYAPYLEVADLSWKLDATNIEGHFDDGSGDADDTIVPEFVDRFNHPMPILYLRARVGASVPLPRNQWSPDVNPVITIPDASGNRYGTHDLHQIIAYTGCFTGTWPTLAEATSTHPNGRSIGMGKDLPEYYLNSDDPIPVQDLVASGIMPYHGLRTVQVQPAAVLTPPGPNYYVPYDAFPYFENPSLRGTARSKDGYILISAGKDRVYGTDDDITTFGQVAP